MRKLLALLAVLQCLFVGQLCAQPYTKAQLQSQISTSFPDNTSGLITPLITRTYLDNDAISYQQTPQVNPQSGPTYTVAASDYGKLVEFTGTGATTFTLPQATSANGMLYFNVGFLNNGTAALTILPQGGSTINGTSGSFTLQVGKNIWFISDSSLNWETFGSDQAGASWLTCIPVPAYGWCIGATNTFELYVNGAFALDVFNNTGAVNAFYMSNAASGDAPFLGVLGSDTNIGMVLQTKGTGCQFIEGGSNVTFATCPSSTSDVNHIEINSNSTGGAPLIEAIGTDTNVSMFFSTQHAGSYNFYTNAFTNAAFQILANGTTVDFPQIFGGPTGTPGVVSYGAGGSDTNIAINFYTKGSGSFTFNSAGLPIGSGGTGAQTQQAALNDLMPSSPNAGEIAYYNGTNWVGFAGNTSGTLVLSENASGVPSWVAQSGGGTVTSITAGWGLSSSPNPITTSGTNQISTSQPPYSFDAPVNLGLSASAASSALTITMTGANGSAPSSTNPVCIPFRSTTLATGTPNWSCITATQSITIPSGATLGTSSGVAFRVWLFEEYNAGSPELVVAVCSGGTTIYPCTSWESTTKTTTTISASATSAGVPYATTGVSSDALRIIGYCDYSSGLTTAGTWASACTTLQLFGPGIKRPGEVIQTVWNLTSTPVTNGSGTFPSTTTASLSITLAMSPNMVAAGWSANQSMGTGGAVANLQMYRVTSATFACTTALGGEKSTNTTSIAVQSSANDTIIDKPGTTSQLTYGLCYGASSGTQTVTNGSIRLDEIMG
jgi:hypothetical protein